MSEQAQSTVEDWAERELDEQITEMLERKILGAPENMVRIFAHLTILKEALGSRRNPYEGSFEPKDVDLLTFATAVDLAGQISARNEDSWMSDHWISDSEVLAWNRAEPADAILQIDRNHINLPYREYQSAQSVRTAISLLPLLTTFRDPLK